MKYESLVRRYKEQLPANIFAHFPYRGDEGETWQTRYEKLSGMAKDEEWDFNRNEFKKPGKDFPILEGFLNYTFLRIQEQGRIVFSEENDKACFNTGLQTRESEKDIYATFYKNRHAEQAGQPDWMLFGFFDSYSERLSEFRPLPSIATYIEDLSSLFFDLNCKIDVNYDHIFEANNDRLPEALRGNKTMARMAMEGAVAQLREKISRNYKIAIPHWYENKMQLLLPLNLTSDTEADLALVAEKDPSGNVYLARTVLTMAMAYMDARLITSPDRAWLNP